MLKPQCPVQWSTRKGAQDAQWSTRKEVQDAKEDGDQHNAYCNAAERADSAFHVGSAGGAEKVSDAFSRVRCTCGCRCVEVNVELPSTVSQFLCNISRGRCHSNNNSSCLTSSKPISSGRCSASQVGGASASRVGGVNERRVKSASQSAQRASRSANQMSHPNKGILAWESRPRRGREQVTWELRNTHSRWQFMGELRTKETQAASCE